MPPDYDTLPVTDRKYRFALLLEATSGREWSTFGVRVSKSDQGRGGWVYTRDLLVTCSKQMSSLPSTTKGAERYCKYFQVAAREIVPEINLRETCTTPPIPAPRIDSKLGAAVQPDGSLQGHLWLAGIDPRTLMSVCSVQLPKPKGKESMKALL